MKFSTFRSRKPASKRQPASRRRRRALFESLESRQLLAVDLQVTDAYLIDGMGLRINEPVLGEQMFVRVEFATTDLPVGSQYQVEVQIDGVPRRSGTLFNGAGSATGSGSVTLNGWFATQPTHELFARVDADNVVPENDELNNSTVVQLNSAAGLPPFKFAWPVGADVYDQVVPLRYVDIDPSGGAMDYAGGTATSNGSFGLTIGAVNFRDQDAGIPVLAAADGVVQSATDGLGDRNTFVGFAPGNSVIIDHGNGWTTEYRHLRRDSVTVVPNQLVTAGETIGMLGASGGSSGPNVEFVVRHLGRVVDPLIDPSSLLLFPVPSYSGDTVALIDGGVTTYDPTNDLLEGPSELAEWSPVGSQNMYAWGAFTGLKQDDELKAVWYRPDQTEDGFEIVTVLQDTNFLRQAFQNPAMTQRDTGTWTVEFLVNDVKVGERTFEVVSPGQPDAYFTRFGSQVVDDRFTPLNIGSSTVGNVFRPTMTIFVSNLGDDLLTFGAIDVPPGFVVTQGLPAGLIPGASTSFQVALQTNVVGQFSGDIHVETNDPDESDYRFAVEGRVLSVSNNPPLIFLGIGERQINEDGRTIANVRLSQPISQPVTVTLSADDLSEVSLPSSITLPAGRASGVFYIDGVDDGILDGIDTVAITATAPGYDAAHATVDVFDFANDAPTISAIDDLTILEEEVAGPLPFTIGDTETPTSNLIVSVTSSNQALLPDANITLGGAGAARDLTLTPLPDQFGDTTITVTVTDEGGLATEETFVLTVDNVNDVPTDITLVPGSIAENTNTSAGNVPLGAFRTVDPDLIDNHVYSLIAGAGSTDNNVFVIAGDILQVRRDTVLDFETKSSYSIRVASTDGTDTLEKVFTVHVSDVNEPPTDITLSNAQVNENVDTFTGPFEVGQLAPVDPDQTGQYTFSLVAGAGDTDNAKFQINGSSLQIRQNILFDFEAQSSFSVRVQVSDGVSTFVKPFTITVNNLDEIDLVLTDPSISENGGMTTARAVRTNTNGALTVTLASSDISEATVVSSIVIPDGQAMSDPFPITAVDDSILDGTRTVVISASAPGVQTSLKALLVTDHEPLTVNILDASISENGGSTIVTVTRTDPTGSLIVNLTSNDTSEATVIGSVTIPDGVLTSSPVAIDAVDDLIVDGTQAVSITASAAGYVDGVGVLQVADFEPLMVELTDASISENGGQTTLVVTRTDTSGDLTVQLTSSDATAASLPVSIVIPDGAAQSDPITVSAVDDSVLDGSQTTTITASAVGYEPAGAMLTVTDYEQLVVSIADASISEHGGVTTATISRGSETNGELTVQLASSDPTEATVPLTVTIPDGQTTSAPFNITGVDDAVLDGTRTTTISASATGYVTGTAAIDVTDFEPLTVTLSASTISENGGLTTLTVSREDASTALVVTLGSSDTSEINVPQIVLLGIGQKVSPPVQVSAVDDQLLDGTQTVQITASADLYASGSASIDVTDVEALLLTIQTGLVPEGSNAQATVTRTDSAGDLTVTLVSNDTSEATVPTTIVIPDGQKVSAPFDIAGVDDGVIDGTNTVLITASAAGYLDAIGSIDVRDSRALTLTINDLSISEQGGSTTATVARLEAGTALTVQLAADVAGALNLPASVTIPTGATVSAPFTISAIDDQLVNGNRPITITASAAGQDADSASLTVTDFEPLSLSFNVTSVSEQNGAGTGTVTRTDTRGDLQVTLLADQPDELIVPSSITIPDGQPSATFSIMGVNDNVIDGTQTVQVTATASGYESAAASVDVVEERLLTVIVGTGAISERNGTTSVVVTRTDSNGELVVALESSDTSELTLPDSITIPDGSLSSTSVLISAVDDTLLDGDQTVTISASAIGHVAGTDSLVVTDYEQLLFSPLDVNLVEGAKATVTLTRTNTDTAQPLSVFINYVLTNELDIPAQVTIPANESSITFEVSAFFDDVTESQRFDAVYPEADGYFANLTAVTVNDNPKPFQNPQNHLNVNNDAANEVSPIDVGIIITDLNTNGSRTLDYPSTLPEFFLDVNGDNSVSPIDALLVINHLNDNLAGEGEALAADASLLPAVANALQASGERPAGRTNNPAATSNAIHKPIADVDSLAERPVGEPSSLDSLLGQLANDVARRRPTTPTLDDLFATWP